MQRVRLLSTPMFAQAAEEKRCCPWGVSRSLPVGERTGTARGVQPGTSSARPQVRLLPVCTRMRGDWMASALPTSARLSFCLYQRPHKCLVISFRPHLEPVRWTLLPQHFRNSWLRKDEKLTQSHIARQRHSQSSRSVWIYS